MELDFQKWMLVFLRLGAFLLALPFFSATNIPVRLRIALGAMASLLLAPTLPAYSLNSLPLFSIIGVMAQEIGVGLLMGFVARLIFFAAELAGSIVATEVGLNMGTIFNPMGGGASPIPGAILFYLSAIVMLSLDLHHWLLLGFGRTYSVLPMGSAHLSSNLFNDILARVSSVFVLSLQISAPVLAVSFVITVIFGVLSRAVPQMNVFQMSFPFRIAAGLAVFGFTLQIAAQYVSNYLNRLPDDLLRIGQMMGLPA